MNTGVAFETVICLGMPVFNGSWVGSIAYPYGQRELYRPLFGSAFSLRERRVRCLIDEYLMILAGLLSMGIRPVVLFPRGQSGRAIDSLIETLDGPEVEVVEVSPSDPRPFVYVRDLAVSGPRGLVLVAPYALETPREGMVVSVLGQGGRVLHRGGVAALIDCRYPDLEAYFRSGTFPDGRQVTEERVARAIRRRNRPPVKDLTGAGFRQNILLPGPVWTDEPHSGGKVVQFPQNHLDRGYALLGDKSGSLHLIVDPLVCTGFRGIFDPPEMLPKEALDTCRRRCERVGVQLHVPKRPFGIPLSIGMWQAPDGRVLMTSGEPTLEEVVKEIVGSDRVFITPEPVVAYPLLCDAGIRCLINELPRWFVEHLSAE